MRSAATVPVHVLSGFLGSGKTTLLNRLLAALPAGTRPAIVVNDFGAVAVDGALVDRGRYAVAELASGCVCCTLSAPLQEALSALLDDEQPDTILMETTGPGRTGRVSRAVRGTRAGRPRPPGQRGVRG